MSMLYCVHIAHGVEYGLNMGSREEWKIAGFVDEYSQIGRKVPHGKIHVPSGIALTPDSEGVTWSAGSRQPGKWISPTPAMFTKFAGLWRRTPQEVCDFAKTWGAIGVDEDGRYNGGRRRSISMAGFREPISAWRYFSRRMDAALTIAACLQQGKRGRAEDWGALSRLVDHLTADVSGELDRYPAVIGILASNDCGRVADLPIEQQRALISVEATLWLRVSGLGFAFSMKGAGDAVIEIDYNACLLAAIALQLSLTVCRSEGPHICSGCGDIYFRMAKQAKEGNSNFCPGCGRGAALKNADKRRWEKMKTARAMHEQGISIPEIVRRLNVRETVRSSAKDTVRRWISGGR